LVGLDREHEPVERPRIGKRSTGPDREAAPYAVPLDQRETVALERFELCTAIDADDVSAAARQPGSNQTADRSGAKNTDTQVRSRCCEAIESRIRVDLRQ